MSRRFPFFDNVVGTMLDYNYVQGIFEVMVGVSCCRNENDHFALDRIWETNKQV